jgi:hypothetical protein
MKTLHMLLGGAIMLWMMPTSAEEAKSNNDKQQIAALVSGQAAAMASPTSSFNNNYRNLQAPIYQNRVSDRGRQQDDNSRIRQIPVKHRTRFDDDDVFERHHRGWNNGWHNRDRVKVEYRTAYYPSYFDSYRASTPSWPSYYHSHQLGWHERGWRVDYQTVDPYWFAIISSIAVSQAWSNAQLARAINDDNLRQQMIEDEAIRQQMIASGYPRDQVYYPPRPQSYYSSPTISTTPIPNPNSPLYGAKPLASGEQVANLNANKNVMFFCHFGNKQQTAEAFRQLKSPDMSVWKNLDSFNKCRAWASLP